MKSRIFATEDTVPEKFGEYWYYTRLGERDEFSIYCRKRGSMENPEEEVHTTKYKKILKIDRIKFRSNN